MSSICHLLNMPREWKRLNYNSDHLIKLLATTICPMTQKPKLSKCEYFTTVFGVSSLDKLFGYINIYMDLFSLTMKTAYGISLQFIHCQNDPTAEDTSLFFVFLLEYKVWHCM